MQLLIFFIIIFSYLGLGAFLVWYLLHGDKGQKEPVAGLWVAFLYGLLAVFLALFINSARDSLQDIYATFGITGWWESMKSALYIGITEEFAKFIGLALFLYWRSYFDEFTDGIIYFAIAGLTFAVAEDIFYYINIGNDAIIRILFGGFFHAATTAIAGFFLIRAKLLRKSLLMPALALLFVSFVHALFDFLLFRGSAAFEMMAFFIVIGLNISLFIIYRIAQEYDQSLRGDKLSNSGV